MSKNKGFLNVILVGLVWLAYCGQLCNADFAGKVVGVSDGDTITVLKGTDEVKVRLDGIDAPEKAQPWGARAKQAASEGCFGKTVTVIEKDTDRYGRTIGVIEVDGRNLNLALVRSGYAWWYRKYAGDNEELAEAETEARKAKRGLWQDATPVPPWDWRDGEREGSPVIDDDPSDYTHWINNDSDKRHRKGCRYFGNGNGRPCKEDEGEPCKVCGG